MSRYFKDRYDYNLKRSFKQCQKVVLVKKEDHSRTCGVLFQNGKMAVGDDCWRLSNRMDSCEYPFKIYSNSLEVEETYTIQYPAPTVFFDERGKEA